MPTVPEQPLDRENSYSNILKAFSAFGGVQLFAMLINMVRGKLVAVILGASGIGINSIFSTALASLSRFASLGLNVAVVKEAAARREDAGALKELLKVVGYLLQFTGVAGCLVCVAASPWLSRISFGTTAYWWQFMLLGAAVYFTVVATGRLSVLQGLHEVKRVSKASLVGAVVGLAGGVPLYWFFGDKGIVPAIVLLQFCTWLFYTFHLRKACGPVKPQFKPAAQKPLVKHLLWLGLVLLSGDIIRAMCEYGVNVFLRVEGGLDLVGLYQSANNLTNQYSGVLLTAMMYDYFPRLAASIKDGIKSAAIVNRQLEIVALAVAPVACLAMAFAPLVVRILLTGEFESIVPLVRLMALGVVLKAIQYPMGFIAFAKDNKKLFFWMEAVTTNVIYVAGIFIGYRFWGFLGLGYAFVADNLLCIFLYGAVNRWKYGFAVKSKALRQVAIAVLISASALSMTFFEIPPAAKSIGLAAVVCVSVAYTFINLRKLMRKS